MEVRSTLTKNYLAQVVASRSGLSRDEFIDEFNKRNEQLAGVGNESDLVAQSTDLVRVTLPNVPRVIAGIETVSIDSRGMNVTEALTGIFEWAKGRDKRLIDDDFADFVDDIAKLNGGPLDAVHPSDKYEVPVYQKGADSIFAMK